ncbi:MAG: peptidase S41, partial [Deltaproteobacteria bacterium]|nr:peptidase S41 [Deltaproteobacteria bacterium]
EDIRDAGPLKGLVLDLRGNPGGLLDQAAKVADLFVQRGTIVSMVGASEGREDKKASPGGTEPSYPLVVLVSGSSASASEIVAGALKQLGRAVIIGQTTFGKGSVQLVFPDVTSDKAALKLTIAQYLTPGDTSIQGVGVTPHIELDPMTVDELEMDLTVKPDGVKERDLSQHLSNTRATKPSTPAQVVRYFLPQQERQARRERGGELDDVYQRDFAIEFAHGLATRLPAGENATTQLTSAGRFIQETQDREIKKVEKALAKLDIDWAVPADKPLAGPSKNDFTVQIETVPAGAKVVAGKNISIKLSVTNSGTVPVYRLRATTESDNPYFDEKELVFGKIPAGETKTATAPLTWCDVKHSGRRGGKPPKPEDAVRECKIPMDALSRSDGVKVHFDAAGGHTPASAELRPTIEQLDRPVFQYSYQVSDNLRGNGDGLLQRGEQVTIYLKVKNVGTGRSFETQANLANRSGDGVLLRNGRFDVSNMLPGDERQVAFTFDVQRQLAESEVVLLLSVTDRDLREAASEKLKLPVTGGVTVAKAKATVTTTTETQLYGDVLGSREPFGKLAKGVALHQLGRRGKMARVQLAASRFAFLRTADLKEGGAAQDEVRFDTIYGHAPPILTVKTSAAATRGSSVKIQVEAYDAEGLLDMYMFVGPRKLYYQSNRKGTDPNRAQFEFDAPLQPGVNLITVVARDSPDTTTRRVLVVRRDAADGSILKTPKRQGNYLLEAVK